MKQKQQVFYIHGGSSYTKHEDFLYDLAHKELWTAPDQEKKKFWPHRLRSALGDEHQVFMPSMPNSDNAKYDEWKLWFERHFEFLKDDVILVCWSLGATFIAKYVSEQALPVRVKHLFMLAGPYDYFVSEECREDGGDFYPDITLIPQLAERCAGISILHSKDDFVVPYEHALKYKAVLPEAELISFEDKNHFLVEELPELVECIKVATMK